MPTPYSINTIDLRTGKRTLIDSREDTCLFGPVFSPDEKWILYIAGYYDRFSPRSSLPDRHMFDLCIARADGSEIIDLTDGLAHYNRTSFGPPEHRRRGSNCPIWLDSETVLYSKRSPGAHPDCNFDVSLGNHREDPYDPSMAKGGCQLMKLNIITREETPLTSFEEGKWDFRATLSPDKEWLAYISVRSGGQPSELRICKLDGSENRFLTRGLNGLGVDHPVFSEQ
jgi:Tol biopolymer transport system component